MGKRNKKRKRKQGAVIVTTILIILFLTIFYTNGVSNNDDNDINNEYTEKNDKSDNSKNEKIIELKVTPEKYITYSDEKINLSSFKVLGVSENKKEVNIDKDIEFSITGDTFNIEDNMLLVSSNAITADNGILTISYGDISKNVEIKVFNNLDDNIDGSDIITNSDAYDMVVNKTRNLASDYVPSDLVPLDDIPTVLQNSEINQLRKAAYDALKELFLKAEEEKSFKLYARSGYRSYRTQNDLYNSYVANHGQLEADTFSAKPGQSEHQSGLSIDITCEAMNFQLDDTFFDTVEGKWVSENAHRFGFIIRYPKGKESITGYQYEPWHLRYVGKTLATEIYESQLTMEEYFEQLESN